MVRYLANFLRTWWQQLIGIPMALFAFFIAPVVLRFFDPTAAAYDAGLLHTPVLVWVEFLIYNALAWVGVIVSFKPLASWFRIEFHETFKTLTSWQKLKLSFAVYFTYLLLFVLLTLAL